MVGTHIHVPIFPIQKASNELHLVVMQNHITSKLKLELLYCNERV